MNTNKLYSVLTCNIGNYEIVREVQNPSPFAEYILVTDNKELKSDTWTIVYDDSFDELYTPYAASFYIRSHPFEYVNTDVCIWIDGSINIKDDFTEELMMPFIQGEYVVGEVLNIVDGDPIRELDRWGQNEFHGYTREHADKVINYLKSKYFECPGLVQNTIYLTKNVQLANKINNRWWELLVRLGEFPEVDQESMSIRSYVLWNYLKDIRKIMILSQTALWCKYFEYCYHGSNESQRDSFVGNTVPIPETEDNFWFRFWESYHLKPKILKFK